MNMLYGIKNCDTVRKARRWLDANQIEYQFQDYRDNPISKTLILDWLQTVDEKVLLNTRSTTWRTLSEADKQYANQDALAQLLHDHPTLIKRPVLVHATQIEVGFKDARYQEIFS